MPREGRGSSPGAPVSGSSAIRIDAGAGYVVGRRDDRGLPRWHAIASGTEWASVPPPATREEVTRSTPQVCMSPQSSWQRVGWRPQLPQAARGAAVPLDVILFSGATVLVAAHAALDSFIAPEPRHGRRRSLPARPRHLLCARPRRGRLSPPARRRAGGACSGPRGARSRGSSARDRGRHRRWRTR